MGKDNRRRIVLINKSFQYKMIIKFILVNILVMLIFGTGLYMFMNSEIDSELMKAHVTYKNMKDMLFPVIITLSVINVLVSSVIISLFVTMASFRIAGPLYRFNEIAKSISERNLTPHTGIRKGDQLYEFSKTISLMKDVLARDLKALRMRVDELKNEMENNSTKDENLKKIILYLESKGE